MRKLTALLLALSLFGTQAGAEGCGGKANPDATPATQPPAAPPQPEGQREPVPAPADPKPHDRSKPDKLRDIYFDGDRGKWALIAWGLQPGDLTRERIQLPAKRSIRVPSGPILVLVVDSQLEDTGEVSCRIVDRETGNDTARQKRSGFRAYVSCLEEFVTK